jgi:hypothetical protein
LHFGFILAYLSLKVVVKQNVGGCDVTMDDAGMTVFMKVCKLTCRSKGNSHSCGPVHDNPSLLAYKMPTKSPIDHIKYLNF